MEFQRGDCVTYVTPTGNIYKGTVTHSFGPNTPRTVVGCPNACIFIVNEATIKPYTVEYSYKIGDDMMVHKSRLVKDIMATPVQSFDTSPSL